MKPETLRKLSALGLSVEQIAGVLEVMAEDAEEGKEKARERWRRWKAKQPANVGKRLQTDANVSKQLARVEDSSSKEEISGKVKEERTPAASPSRRATRLSADWVIPESWLREAIAAGLSRPQALASAETMKNWSLSDPKGAKLDWLATWRNWFAREMKHQQRAQPRSGAPPAKPTVVDAMHEIFRERGWTPDEPEQLSGNHGNGELVSAGFGGGTKGTVVDLREGAWRRAGSGD